MYTLYWVSQMETHKYTVVFGPTLMWPPAHLVSVKKGSEYTKIKLFYYLEFLLILWWAVVYQSGTKYWILL